MPINIEMPRLSDTMQAGTVVKWNVKEGQTVKSGDVIADIETDKATMELQTFDDGVVAALAVPEGKSVPIGTVIMVLAGAGEDASAAKAATPIAAKAAAGSDSSASALQTSSTAVMDPPASGRGGTNGRGISEVAGGAEGRIFASPLARKIAAETGVNLTSVQGSGPGGRIVRKDVEAAAGKAPAGAPASKPGTPATQSSAVRTSLPPAGASLSGKVVALSNMRRVIAKRLVESKQTIPHYQVSVDVDMDALMSLRGQLNEQLAGQGVKLSVNDFLVRACALAMHEHPTINARWVPTPDEESIEILGEVNIGIAIALPEEKGGGLVVGTIRSADQAGLRQISAMSGQLAEKARGKGLSPQEMSDSTFTISNLGMFGVSHFTAIVNPPNAAILAVGAAIQRPVVRNGEVVPGHVMTMTMSSDHRIIDGAMAARYLASVRTLLEKPATLLV